MEKVYEVEFMEYTNACRDTITNNAKDVKDKKFIYVGKDPFLVRESELEKYIKFGPGIRSLKFVGNIEENLNI